MFKQYICRGRKKPRKGERGREREREREKDCMAIVFVCVPGKNI